MNQAELISKSPYHLRFTLATLPKRPNEVRYRHWRHGSNDANRMKALVSLVVGWRTPIKPLEKFQLVCHRYAARFLDYDSLTWSFKSTIDGLVNVGVIKDDSFKRTGKWDVDQFKVKKKDGEYLMIEVKEVS